MGIVVRTLVPEEAPAASLVMDEVMQRAYKAPSFAAQIGWYAAVQPDCLVVATDDSTGSAIAPIVGTGCGIAYPDARFGWIGLIATEPAYERQGIGARLTEHVAQSLAGHGCASVLDASVAGGPLYERMGFVDHGPTRVMLLDSVAAGSAGADVGEPINVANLADVVAYDASVFGAERRSLLRVLVTDYPGRSMLVRSRDGAVSGFVIAQHAVVGPLAAADSDSLAALVRFAAGLGWERGVQLCVPPESEHLATLIELGWRTVRELRNMRRGIDTLPGSSRLYAGRVSLGFG